jgi:hypothetical protein
MICRTIYYLHNTHDPTRRGIALGEFGDERYIYMARTKRLVPFVL